jgi:4-amino-4-deoxy-L-arabinose transferase-like glycosyltransferase
MNGEADTMTTERQTDRLQIAPNPGEWLAFLGILALFSFCVLRRLGDSSLGYPDADRILMDGVFFRDFFFDLPWSDPYGYVKHYFAQYPALSLGYRPPFFPFVEGLFNSAFGLQMWSSRLALLAFGLVGLTAFFFTVRRMHGGPSALAATALLATTPFVLRLSWYTMGEVPVLSMALVTVFFYDRYLASGKTSHLIAAAVAAVLAVWTKQTAFFLLIWMLLHQLTTGGLVAQLRQRRVWLTIALVVIGLIPLLLITLWLGDQNLAQSIGMAPLLGQQAFAADVLPASLAARLNPDVLLVHLEQIYQVHLTWPALGLSAVGFAWALWMRDKRVWFWVSFIIVVYLVFTYIKGQNPRYPIFWIPAFLVLASMPLSYLLPRSKRGFQLYAGIVAATVAWQVFAVYQIAPKYATGYDEAAQFVLEHSESPTVFFDGYNNGYFTYFMRALDPARSMYVLRGDKLLSSTSIAGRNRLEVHAKDERDIIGILEQYGVQYVVVEDKNTIKIPIHDVLRRILKQNSRFELAKAIPVDTGSPSTREPLAGVTLLIYEMRDRGMPKDGVLELRLPVVGQTLRVPLRGLQERSPDQRQPQQSSSQAPSAAQ